jgi:hypothetical protein
MNTEVYKMIIRYCVNVTDDFKARVNEYNKRNPDNELDVGKALQETLHEKLKDIEKDSIYCVLCRKIKPNNEFDLTRNTPGSLRGQCKECVVIRRERMYKWDWDGNKHKAIERTNGKCAICGIDYREVHHINPNAGHELNNLVALCHRCHLKAHNGAYTSAHGLNQEFIKIFESLVSND